MSRSFCASEDDVQVTLTSFEKQTRPLIYRNICSQATRTSRTGTWSWSWVWSGVWSPTTSSAPATSRPRSSCSLGSRWIYILMLLFYVNTAMMVTMLGDGGDGGVGELTWEEPGIFHHAQSSSAGHDKGHPPPHPLCLHLRDEMQQTELAVKRTYIFNQASTPGGLSWWRR